MKPSKAKAYESTADFKERIAALRKQLFKEPDLPKNGSYFKNGYYVTRGSNGTPTPSEVLGGRKMPKLEPPKDKEIAKWLRSLGVKV